MRDWQKAFRRASFRGVRFWVDEDGPEGGRRIAVHEISGGNVPVIEDMGKATRPTTVTAYVASDAADAEGLALEAACDGDGPGMLVLPMDAGRLAYCEGCRRSRHKDKNGYIAYDMSFISAGGSGAAAGSGLSILRGVFSGGLTAAASALAGAF